MGKCLELWTCPIESQLYFSIYATFFFYFRDYHSKQNRLKILREKVTDLQPISSLNFKAIETVNITVNRGC